ncbi:MAG: amino acid adenylation domain-containing protein [Tistlia sp.]|uniref:amino acid adenylation domain-containing protein n=1 Tax=Tistlia sp. TaxID=3057121 RepID=UPI0034A4F7F9
MSESPEELAARMRRQLEEELVAAARKQAGAARPARQADRTARQEAPPAEPQAAAESVPAKDPSAAPPRFAAAIAEIAATVLKIPPERLDPREKMSRYGVDSIIVTEIVRRISDLLDLPIAPTVFFEARHLEELAEILHRRYPRVVAERFAEAGEAERPPAAERLPVEGPAAPEAAAVPAAEAEGEVQDWIARFRAIAAGAAPPAEAAPVAPAAAPGVRRGGEGGYEPVAIIAMEGTFPESPDLAAFERHLRAGDDCIREVPPDRWDWRRVHGDPQAGEFTNVKYGGFAPDIDKFDPLFFGLSPREAALMDPQHRLFIQCVWKLFESAGYAPGSLSGRKVGLFIGINLQDYAHLIDRAGAMEALHLTSLGHMFCPNRLSFLLDIHGPSQVIDTACSSSLVALHRAVLSVQHEGCEMAVAGGANLLISPDMHIMYSKVGMICEDGRCKTFSREANGYVRADGVGAVLLKTLSHAERDGDTILAVVRGSAENHGGQSTSLTAPNPKAQASLIVEAHRQAGIDPRSVGYIECHGTGTALGDPIEINGLRMAFEALHAEAGLAPPVRAYCGLGSVKSNIGHAETAAGIAGVVKTVLALRNRRLYPTLHCAELNPMIELEGSPFFILQEGREWPRPLVEGEAQPRRAGVSSFGAGGSNAHVVIEEYLAAPVPPPPPAPALILLAARNRARLDEVVGGLRAFLAQDAETAPDLADIAYTLQVGRDAMAERLALVVGSLAELRERLARIAEGGAPPEGCWRGSVKGGKAAAPAGPDLSLAALGRRFAEGALAELAALWTQGVPLDWPALHEQVEPAGRKPRRIALPSYPFARQRHWLPEAAGAQPDRRGAPAAPVLHPLVHRNTSDLSGGQRFTSLFTGREFFLADHVVLGERVLPGVAYLEMARAAVALASPEKDPAAIRLTQVVWARPFAVGERPAPLHVALESLGEGHVAYRIYSDGEGSESAQILHGQGRAVQQAPAPAPERFDLAALRRAVAGEEPDRFRLEGARCYAAFAALGIAYGPGHQGLEYLYFSQPDAAGAAAARPQVLARLALPAGGAAQAPAFALHPGLLDSALQACIGLMAGAGQALPDGTSTAAGPAAALPFGLDSFELLAPLPATLWAWIRYAEGSGPGDRLQKLDLDLADKEGRVCARLRGFSSRTPEPRAAAPEPAAETLLCRPAWVERPAEATAGEPAWARRQVLLCDLQEFFPAGLEAEIAAGLPGATCTRLALGGATGEWYGQVALGLFEAVKAALDGKGRALVQVVVPGRGEGRLLAGLTGLLRTANRESARVFGQLIEVETADGLVARLLAEGRNPAEAQVRYRGARRQVLEWQEAERATGPSERPWAGLPWKEGGVYLVTGGGGGLAQLFARRLAAQVGGATLVLCGRSAPNAATQARLESLAAAGLTVHYRQLDVTDRAQVVALVGELLESHGRLDGVLHAAGLLRDNFMVRKTAAEFEAVLAPKVAGALHLDAATAALDLDFFALFGSAAGAWGSAGQADYAAANGFLDAFAQWRDALVRQGRRRGRSLCLDWPLWAEGGMRMEPAALDMMRQATGLEPLPSDAGLEAFEAAIAGADPQVLVLHGAPERLRALLSAPPEPAIPAETRVAEPAPADDEVPVGPQAGQWQAGIEQMLLRAVAALQQFDLQDLDTETEWSDYGFDSITLTEFSNRLNKAHGLDLTPTLFFEHATIAALAARLAADHGPALAQSLGLTVAAPLEAPMARQEPAVEAVPPPARAVRTEEDADAVAIVGISGRLPQARDLEEFWRNLAAGRDCITRFPAGRLAGPEPTESPWGGFIEGVGDFDARFFGISPREAELIDPQQRLLLQYAWKAVEDAGYAPGSLTGSSTAVFVATAASGYGDLMARSGASTEAYSSTGVIGSIGPNRLSYLLDLHGPSEPVETACSSALVAIHRAVSSLARGECEQAIAGGINLLISAETHLSFAKAGMLSPDGRCKSFSSQANGYVRGEGVGMLFLKRLTAAEAAGDPIYAVIRGSAENHGGRAQSLTAPNPKAQADLLRALYTSAGIDPRTVGYIEAHGTGTALGDPIEVEGLKTAFRDLYGAAGAAAPAEAHCGLGSVKTNIGHLELAAGVAGVLKVLLQLKHRTLVPSLHCEEVNPYIRLEGSPFYLVRETRDWTALRDAEGRALPRRAGVSSFGFGGVNAHLVLEEYPREQALADRPSEEEALPRAVVLSAKTPERLKAYAASLLAFLGRGGAETGGAETGEAETGEAASAAQSLLSGRLRDLAAEILRVEPRELDPAQFLDGYGFEPLQRTLLQTALQEALGLELGAAAFLENHSLAAIATALLEREPALRLRLEEEAGSPDEEPARGPGGAARPDISLADLAYTLQIGRDPMEERLGLVVRSLAELEERLRAFLEDGGETVAGLLVGRAKQGRGLLSAFRADEDLQEALGQWMRRGKLERLLELWVQGLDLDWQRLYGEAGCYPRRPRRISVPGYPFAEQRHWIEARPAAAPASPAAASLLHPLVHENLSTLRQARFGSLLSGEEFFLADHRVQGRRVLPGVAYLEMARAALALATADEARPEGVVRLQDVVWVAPAVVDRPRRLEVTLTPDQAGGLRYEVSSRAADEAGDGEQQVHGRGAVSLGPAAEAPRLDLPVLRARTASRRIEAAECYAAFAAAGLDYGPGHRGLEELQVGEEEVLARLRLPAALAATLDRYVLHPCLLDSALQASIGLTLGAAAEPGAGPTLALPFAVESLEVFGACTAEAWAWVRPRAGSLPGARVRKLDIDLCDDQGRVQVRIAGLTSRLVEAAPAEPKPAAASPAAAEPQVRREEAAPLEAAALRSRTVAFFKELLSTALKFPVEEIRADDALDSYGIDSMMVMELTTALEQPFGALSKTLFFEYQTLGELVDHFLEAHRPQLLALFAADEPAGLPSMRAIEAPLIEVSATRQEPSPRPAAPAAGTTPGAAGPLDIAIVGLSGRYPQSRTLDDYWRNLRDGRDCITEVPAERWDWRAFYGEDGGRQHACKWGGFIAEADCFDPLFFNISPGAAEYMDPQERIFLEHAWMAMEDAGYRREDLQKPPSGAADEEDLPAQVGVYAGVMYGEYQLLGLEARLQGRDVNLGNFYASIANRASYALNLHGPSMAVDTMCSSSLTAIHLACQDLRLGRTDLALAGGVNLNVHPSKYSLLSAGQFISARGKCESFGAGGEGYVPSEGVGVVLLKRLAEAERDGDHIYGVIKSSALNHGGRTNGYSVPNPRAQQAVIDRALREAAIDPRAIGYLEAHGTGTRLGDPIEIAGLTRAFGRRWEPGTACWIGSSKSNIGHTEAAAGIAALTKVLLQLREGQIAPSLHAETPNPNIDFASAPFRVNRELRPWPAPVIDGRSHRRVAGVSSFGAGGANAHLLVEEYVPAERPAARRPAAESPALIPLSARTEAQLRDYADSLLAFIRERGTGAGQGPSLRDLAYTLQVGREAMPYRLAFLAVSLPALAERLERFLAGDRSGLAVGRARSADAAPAGPADAPLAELPAAWVGGAALDWRRLYPETEEPPARISLPTYPFARERYWIALPETASRPATPAASAPAARREEPAAETLLARPLWRAQEIPAAGAPAYGEHRILAVGRPPALPGLAVTPLASDSDTLDGCFGDYALQVFEALATLLRGKPTAPVLLQVVIGEEVPGSACPGSLCAALAGLLKTAAMENPQVVGQVIELDAAALALDPEALAGLLRANGGSPADRQVRYRQGRREVPGWAELEAEPRPAPPAWRQGGVYLITGGAGGLGLIFAREIVRQVPDVTLILTGRSPLDAPRSAALEALRAEGARVEYRRLDVADAAAVRALVEELEREGRAAGRPALDGILHSAGITRDAFLLRKSAAEFREVLAAKVSGVVNLDRATRSLDLDFFVLFASLAGALGNPGQGDYATANAFLDAYAAHRNRLAAGAASDDAGLPPPRGRTLSLDWPLWRDGGMTLDARSQEQMWRGAGLLPLETAAGIAAFYRALGAEGDQILVLQGDGPRLRGLFLGGLFLGGPAETADRDAPAQEAPVVEAPAAAPPAAEARGGGSDSALLAERIAATIATRLSEMLKLPSERIEEDVPLEEYGLESVSMMKLTDDLEKLLGPLSRTLFFEYPTIEAVSAHLAGTHGERLAALFDLAPDAAPPAAPSPVAPPAPEAAPPPAMAPSEAVPAPPLPAAAPAAATRDIAIVGMAGRFPQAEDLEAFWQNLAQGRDCITEVPAARWDHGAYFDPDRTRAGKTYCKWGGFLEEVERFDAAFFRITPSEAELLDPQERLFLETVWTLLESSGYLGETLQRLGGSRVGVFVGSMTQQHHAFQSDLLRESLLVLSSPSSIANRVSYFFDFQGPSVAVDTLCSSALNAVHMACESLLRGECRLAIAGGVNLTIHPKKYVGLSAAQLIGSHPDSTSFGEGDGYLPAEAVGAVLLKPLQAALEEGDEILAVIKSTAVNHAGQSNGYRVPSASAQADLIAGNFARAGIDPRSLSYVESAANGSPLGDAIELRALSEGFRRFTDDRQFCAIGSVKSNIGHAEAASGISQLIKVVLQLRHRQLVPTIKAEPLNPNLDFAQTPFRLQRRLEDWRRPVISLDGGEPREQPRRASVSSFGAGGSNAHLILEEYDAPAQDAPRAPQNAPQLIPLSARTAAQLAVQVRRLLEFLEQRPELPLADLAYTLQTGREAMAHRLAFVVEGREQLLRTLRAFLGEPGEGAAAIQSGTGDDEASEIRQLLSGRTGRATLELLLAERDLEKLALYWARGARIAWQALHIDGAARRAALPTYPFERQRHWLGEGFLPGGQPQAEAAPAEAFAFDAACSLQDNMERYLTQGVRQLTGLAAEAVTAAASFLDQGLDSLSLTRLRRGFEQTFGVTLSSRDLLAHPSPATLAAFAATRQDEPAPVAAEDPGVAEAAGGEAPLPLSEGQKGLWLLQQLDPRSSAYNVPVALRFGPGLDAGRLRRACELLLRRFPVLGSVFGRQEEELTWRVPADARLQFEQERTALVSEAEILELLRARSRQPFDLERGPLLRVLLLSPEAGERSYLLILVHHIVFDGRSAMLLVKALLETYGRLGSGALPEPPMAAGYGAFVRWQQDFLAGSRAQAQLAYWQRQLAGDLPGQLLLGDYPRPAVPGAGASHEASLAPELARRAEALARSLQVNLSVVFLGALKLLLHRYSGEEDILVGMPTAGRPEERFEGSVGYFVNPVVLRSRLSGEQAAADFLRHLQLTLAEALDHADYPFPTLLQSLRLTQDQAGAVPYQVVFAYQNFVQQADLQALRAASGALPPVELLPGLEQEGGQDLALEVTREAEGFRLRIDYDAALFRADSLHRLMAHYLHLLDSLASRPQASLRAHALPAVPLAGATSGDEAEAEGLVAQFRRQAALTPEAPALLFERETLSYAELDRRSARLAALLRRRGLAGGEAVGVCLARGPAAVVALLAIWRAGGVYLPVAPDHPVERLRHLFDDSAMTLLVADAAARERVATLKNAPPCVAIEDLSGPDATADEPTPAEPTPAEPGACAYVIYTSGSTGEPKGVAIPHRAIGHHCRVVRDCYGLTPRDRILQFAATTFDASLEQILPGLLSGAAVVLRPEELWSARSFRRKVAELALTVIDLPPGLLHELLLDTAQTSDWAALASLRLAIVGGEALSPETLSLWRDSPLGACRLVNAYGPTETTVTSLLYEAGDACREPGFAGPVPIGRPLPGESACVLDRYGQPVAVGVPGELHIGGAGLALGYLNRPELTRERFVESPLDGTRLFRTGDRARWREDGNLEFLGRLDRQVKVRGFRVEPGEIEAALRGLEPIRNAAVLLRPVKEREQLVAFVVFHADSSEPETHWLKSALAERLPDYMIPAVVVSLPELPVTAGGKIDRKALAQRQLAAFESRAPVEPRTALESDLAAIWREVLAVERIGVYDDFFDLGGHSLLAVRLAGLVHRRLGREMPIASLFEAPTIAGQAQFLDKGELSSSPLVCLQPKGADAPWFCVHGGSGNVLAYRELARSLGEQRPVYALQAPGAAEGAHPGSIEDLAELYVAAIRGVQPSGPYHLGGWSMGGLVAYEMARCLRRDGEEVATLALIDSYTPEALKTLEERGLAQLDRPGADRPGAERALLLAAFARELGLEPPTVPDPDIEALLERTQQERLLPPEIEPAEVRRMFALFRANAAAMDAYLPGPYRGRVRFFAARDSGAGETLGGWSTPTGGDLESVTLAGDHYSLLRAPQVRELAEELRRFLATSGN